jgi:hypothetical protein
MHSLHHIATWVKKAAEQVNECIGGVNLGQIAPRVQLGDQHVNGLNTCLEPVAAFREKREAVFTRR